MANQFPPGPFATLSPSVYLIFVPSSANIALRRKIEIFIPLLIWRPSCNALNVVLEKQIITLFSAANRFLTTFHCTSL